MRNSKPDDQDHGSEERGDDMKHIHRVAAALPLDSEDEKIVDALVAKTTSNLSTRSLQRLTGTISRVDHAAGQVSVTFSAPEAVLRRLATLMWHGTEVTATFPLEPEGDAEKT